MNIIAVLSLLLFFAGLFYSAYYFYQEKSYKVVLTFIALGAVLGYYFKGLTEARTVGGIGTEGVFMAVTVFFIMLINGIIAQYLSIMLKKPYAKNKKIAYAIGCVFLMVTLLMMLLRLQ